MLTLEHDMAAAEPIDWRVGDKLFNALKLADVGPGCDGYHTTMRGGVLHRHRHTIRHRRMRVNRKAIESVLDFIVAKLSERGFLRRIMPISHVELQPTTLTRTGPNGAGYALRFVDLGRPKLKVGAGRPRTMNEKIWRSDLFEDITFLVKSGYVYEQGPDLVFETYNRYWLEQVATLLRTRGYAVVL